MSGVPCQGFRKEQQISLQTDNDKKGRTLLRKQRCHTHKRERRLSPPVWGDGHSPRPTAQGRTAVAGTEGRVAGNPLAPRPRAAGSQTAARKPAPQRRCAAGPAPAPAGQGCGQGAEPAHPGKEGTRKGGHLHAAGSQWRGTYVTGSAAPEQGRPTKGTGDGSGAGSVAQNQGASTSLRSQTSPPPPGNRRCHPWDHEAGPGCPGGLLIPASGRHRNDVMKSCQL